MRRWPYVLVAVAAGCTDVGTDPDAVVALRFEGSAYPSAVLGDSLRDSLGALQPLQATPLNFRGEPVSGVPVLFSSPDTSLLVHEDGVVFARRPSTGPARVFASIGSLQSAPDSVFIVPRADSIRATKATDERPAGGTLAPDTTYTFTAFGKAEDESVVPVPHWLMSFQLRFHGRLLAPTDTSAAYTFTGTPERPNRAFLDTTNAQGAVMRGVKVTCDSLSTTGPDSVTLIATIRDRRTSSAPKLAQTIIIFRRPATCP